MVGYAYRPVRNDRLSGLAKYTYFYNVPTTGQVTLQDTAAEFIQKSHIGALDLTYDLTSAWSIGGKYAYRLGQVSLDREQPTFFDNAAQLVVLRADWRFRKGWESLVEGRMLDLPDVSQRRGGALVGDLSLHRQEPEGRRRLQLHRLLRRPDRPELQAPGRIRQRHRDDVRPGETR